MYSKSVIFYKRLIVLVIFTIIVALSVTSVLLFIQNKHYREQIAELESSVISSHYDSGDQEESDISENKKWFSRLFAPLPAKYTNEPKTLYLTFDDGPSGRTIEILDILKEKDVKATFFVIGKSAEKNKEILQRIVNEGHTLAVHTYSHNYYNIYASIDTFLTDFNLCYNIIYDTTGIKPQIFRFPGGSVNQYNTENSEKIIKGMTVRGFTYFDWNASSGDTDSKSTKDSIVANSLYTARNKDEVVLLMHDSADKVYTVEALPEVIDTFKEQGYIFEKLTKDVTPVVFNHAD